MSLDQKLLEFDKLAKIKLVFDWLSEPKGKNFIKTTKIFTFKFLHLLKIFQYLLNGNNLTKSLIRARDQFMKDSIATIARNKEGFLFNISRGEDLEIVSSSREKFVNVHFNPKENDIVVDVGSNIGTYTIKAASLVSKNGHVFAIEADPVTFERLIKNLVLNNISNVTAINLAAFDKKKTLKLYRSNVSSTNSVIFKKDSDFIKVQASTLDEMKDSFDIPFINWIKIDVEGAEIEVLNGAKKILSENDNLKILLEVHSEKYADTIEHILKEYNFKIINDKKYESSSWHLYAEKSL